MTVNKEEKPTAGTPAPEAAKEVDVNKVTADATAAAVARIQAIEGIMATFDKSPAAVKVAARKVIDDEKFKPEATKESVTGLVLSAVVEAQNKIGQPTAEEARGLATEASKIPDSSEDSTDPAMGSGDEGKKMVEDIREGMK